jgi:hypothetical protein
MRKWRKRRLIWPHTWNHRCKLNVMSSFDFDRCSIHHGTWNLDELESFNDHGDGSHILSQVLHVSFLPRFPTIRKCFKTSTELENSRRIPIINRIVILFKNYKRHTPFIQPTSCACLFLAGKVEETPKKCKDMIESARKQLDEQTFIEQFGTEDKNRLVWFKHIINYRAKSAVFSFSLFLPLVGLCFYY